MITTNDRIITPEFEIERLAAFERETEEALDAMLDIEHLPLSLEKLGMRPIVRVRGAGLNAEVNRKSLHLSECRKALSTLRAGLQAQ